MYEEYRELESSLHEISKWVGRTRKVLAASGSPAAETYLAATRAIRALKEAWRLHMEFEASLLPKLRSRDLYAAELLEQIVVENEAVTRQITSLSNAPWPRSAQAGLQSIRSGVSEILTQLLTQIERERVAILPAILKLDRRANVTAHTESEAIELMTSN
jgi:hypothetical protein